MAWLVSSLLVAAAWGAEAESNTGSISWRPIGPGLFGAMFGVAVSPHDPHTIVAGGDMGNAFITQDGGDNWRILGRCGEGSFGNPGYRGVLSVCFDAVRPERIWIGSSHGLFLSKDGGNVWNLVLGGTPSDAISSIATDPSAPDIVYAASGISVRRTPAYTKGQIWKSTDGGETWRVLRLSHSIACGQIKHRNWLSIVVDPGSKFVPGKGHSRIYLAGAGGLYASDDSGETWACLDGNLPGGASTANEEGVFVSGLCDLVLVRDKDRSVLFGTMRTRSAGGAGSGQVGGVYASNDGGKTWESRNKGLERAVAGLAGKTHNYSLIAGNRAHPNILYWGCHPYGVFKTVDFGSTWSQVTHHPGKAAAMPDFDGRTIYWRLQSKRGNFDKAYYYALGPVHGLSCSSSDPNVVAYTDNAGIALSVDGGEHWTVSGFEFGDAVWPNRFGDRPPMRLTHKVRSKGLHLVVPLDLAVDPFDPQTIAVGYADIGLMISRDGGEWWEWAYDGILAGEKNCIRAIVFDPDVRGRLWVAGGRRGASGHVYRSDDGGRRFKVIGIDQLTNEASRRGEPLFINALLMDDQSSVEKRTIWAATDLGLFRTDNGTRSWQRIQITSGPERVLQVCCDPRNPLQIYAGVISGVKNSKSGGLFRSMDGGKSWKSLAGRQIGPVRSLSICEMTGTLYVLANYPGVDFKGYFADRKVWRSEDGGDTWTNIRVPRFIASLAVHPKNPDWVFMLTYAIDVSETLVNLFRSRDGGKTWQALARDIALSAGGPCNRIEFAPKDPFRLFVLHNSGVYEGRPEK